MWDALLAFAHANPIDPAIELLAELQDEYDGIPRLSTWLSRSCGVPADSYHQAVSRNIIGGMVKRIRKPGSKHDEIAVLIGAQGTLKSTLISMLAPRPEWYTESVRLGDEAKELVLALAGKAVVEISEMGTRTRDINAIKAMVSRTTDAGRTAYARSVTERPRRNIFVSSTNDQSPLIDDTGNRRFLPVRVAGEIDTAWFKQNARQLIGEAATLETQGHDFAIPRSVWSEATAAQETSRSKPEYEICLGEWFAETPLAVFVTAADLSELVKAAAGRSISASRYTRAMRDLGFINGTKRVEGRPVAIWHRGDLQNATRMVPQLDRGRTIARLQIQAEAPPLAPLPPLASPR
jgi:predicted P-loop ATPase